MKSLKRARGLLHNLLDDTRNDDSPTQNDSIRALGDYKYKSSIPFLVRILRQYVRRKDDVDPSLEYRMLSKAWAASTALSHMDDPRSHSALRAVAVDTSAQTRELRIHLVQVMGVEKRCFDINLTYDLLRNSDDVMIQISAFLALCSQPLRTEQRAEALLLLKSVHPELRILGLKLFGHRDMFGFGDDRELIESFICDGQRSDYTGETVGAVAAEVSRKWKKWAESESRSEKDVTG